MPARFHSASAGTALDNQSQLERYPELVAGSEQRRQRTAARLTRARSAVTLKVTTVVGAKFSRHRVCPAEPSVQLPFF